jgi:hypothetical protein
LTRSLHDWQVFVLILKQFKHTYYPLTPFSLPSILPVTSFFLLFRHALTPFSKSQVNHSLPSSCPPFTHSLLFPILKSSTYSLLRALLSTTHSFLPALQSPLTFFPLPPSHTHRPHMIFQPSALLHSKNFCHGRIIICTLHRRHLQICFSLILV